MTIPDNTMSGNRASVCLPCCWDCNWPPSWKTVQHFLLMLNEPSNSLLGVYPTEMSAYGHPKHTETHKNLQSSFVPNSHNTGPNPNICHRRVNIGIFLAVHWLGLHVSTAGGTSWISSGGTGIPEYQKEKPKKKKIFFKRGEWILRHSHLPQYYSANAKKTKMLLDRLTWQWAKRRQIQDYILYDSI